MEVRVLILWYYIFLTWGTRLSNTLCAFEGKICLCESADLLPKPKVKASQFQVHISYFLQKCKKGKPGEMNLPY